MLKRAYTAADTLDAAIVEGLLTVSGIHAVVKGDLAWSARGETPVTDDTAPSVWVHEENLAKARELIRSRDLPPDHPSWRCPTCNESLEGQFTQCWNCGTLLDEAPNH